MRYLSIAAIAVAVMPVLSSSLLAEVAFPLSRNAVGPEEYYLLEEFGVWRSECLRDRNGEDACEAAMTITDLAAGVELDFAIQTWIVPSTPPQVDIDVVPWATVVIQPYSDAAHYSNYSAAITKVDGEPFDAFWCPLTEPENCNRGPDLAYSDLMALLSGRKAVVTVYNSGTTSDRHIVVTEIEVRLAELSAAFGRANTFSAEVMGIDLDGPVIDTEMCTIRSNGRESRISYTLDEDFDAINTSFREIFRGPRGQGTCPSYVTLAYLTPEMTAAQRSLFCLVYDERRELVGFQQGEQDAYRACRKPTRGFCERVNNSKEAALAITGLASGAVGSAVGATAATGTTVVAHSSGAAIITGSSGYIAGTLGTLGTTVLGVVTAPLAVAAAAVSVVAVGGAVYVCSE